MPLKHNGVGLIQIANKQEMRALGIDSPNMADAVMMTLPDNTVRERAPIRRRIKRI